MHVNQNKYILKKINNFVFIIHQVCKHGVSRRRFTETNVTHFKNSALRTITNMAEKVYLQRYTSKILFIDTEQHSKM